MTKFDSLNPSTIPNTVVSRSHLWRLIIALFFLSLESSFAINECYYRFDANGLTVWTCDLTVGHLYGWYWGDNVRVGTGPAVTNIIAIRVTNAPPCACGSLSLAATREHEFVQFIDYGPSPMMTAAAMSAMAKPDPNAATFIYNGSATNIVVKRTAVKTVAKVTLTPTKPSPSAPPMPPPPPPPLPIVPKRKPHVLPPHAGMLHMIHRPAPKPLSWTKPGFE